MSLYLDDGKAFNSSYEQLVRESYHIRSDLHRAGVVWSVKKCVWSPCTKVEWLGMVWDASAVTLSISERRVAKLKDALQGLLSSSECFIRKLASFNGQVTSLAPVVGDAASLFIRLSQMLVARHDDNYELVVPLSKEVKGECQFWLDNICRLNSRSCIISDPPVSVVGMLPSWVAAAL